MNWIRLDNLEPYSIGDRLSYIREEAECQDFKFKEDAHKYVCETIEKDFPTVYNRLSFDDIMTEYHQHELCDGEEKPTYAVYIHLSTNAVKVLHHEFPEDLI